MMHGPAPDGAMPPVRDEVRNASMLSRLFQLRVGRMLVRNTVVSTAVFLLGLGAMWLLVEHGGMDEVAASGVSFVLANTLHYVLGRTWIFRGTERAVASGYVLFLLNGGVGVALTMGLMALLLEYTPIHYLVGRVLVSVVAGLAMFVLNAVYNFRRV